MRSKRFLVVSSVFLFSILIVLGQWGSVNAFKSSTSFVKTRGSNFVLDGRPVYVNGFNSYWLMVLATNPTDREKVTSVFEQAVAHGLTVARSWAFNDGNTSGVLQTSPGEYNEEVFKGLDFVVSHAKSYGIRLILSFVNNFKDFGGRAQYVQWGRNAGLNIKSDDDFYTNPTVKGYYKNHVKTVMTRVNSISGIAYKDDPTIFSWELINEPRCQSDPSGRTVQGWINEMAAYVKSIDSNHLLEAGMEGFYGESTPERKKYNPVGDESGTDFIANNNIPWIDFVTVHSYPDIWLAGSDENAQLSFLKKWIQIHLEDVETVLKKPVLFAEFGKSYKDTGYSTAQRDRFYNTVYNNIYSAVSSGKAGGGGLFWQLMAEGMDSYADGYDIVLSRNPSIAAIIFSQSHRMSVLNTTVLNTTKFITNGPNS